MSDQDPPRNRRERRAAAKESGQPIAKPLTGPKIKMAQPDRSGPKTKTLLDLYDEKKALLDQGQPFTPQEKHVEMDQSGNLLDVGLGDSEPLGPKAEAIFWAVCLAMVHFTLDVLVYNQYRQEIEWSPIFSRTFTILPVLWVMVYTVRSKAVRRFYTLRQVVFLVIAVGTGCYTIHVANKYEFFAVMKQTPPLGTLWIWSVIEMDVVWAAASVVVDLGFLWWKGYSMF